MATTNSEREQQQRSRALEVVEEHQQRPVVADPDVDEDRVTVTDRTVESLLERQSFPGVRSLRRDDLDLAATEQDVVAARGDLHRRDLGSNRLTVETERIDAGR